jgi:hypothetical protein
MTAFFSKLRAFFGKVADAIDGYKTHLANVLTAAVQLWAWAKHWPIEASGAALLFTCAVSSFCRIIAKKPGPLA